MQWPNLAVFFSSLILFMLLAYFLKDFKVFPFAPIIISAIFVLIFHVICIYIVRSSYVKFIFSYFLITFLSAKIGMSINIHIVLYHG